MTEVIHPTRQDTWLINVQLQNLDANVLAQGGIIYLDLGTFDKMTGGAKQAQANTYRPGGLADPVSLGGKPTVTNVVVSRLGRLTRDFANIDRWLDAVGSAHMKVSRQPLTLEGNVPAGVKPVVYTGMLDRISLPDIDSEGNAAALVELEMVVEGYPSQ